MTEKYAKSNDGTIHLISAINGEYTVCGDAFEGECTGSPFNKDHVELLAWTPVATGPVTCEVCIREIDNCRDKSIKLKRLWVKRP